MPVTYPGGGPQITVEALIRQPRLIARRLTDLASKRFIADKIFARGTSDQVAGGAALFQRSESVYMNRDPEEVGIRAEYPRATWSEALFAAAVKKYGLEVPISFEARRRNQMDQVDRGLIKIRNSVVRYVDALAMATLYADAGQTFAASGDWSAAATDIISDLANMRALVANIDEGYEADTLIVHPNQELDLIVDADLRSVLPREGNTPRNAVVTGQAVPILGFEQILVSNTVTPGQPIVMQARVAGTIADEAPLPDEGYISFTGQNAPPGLVPIYTKVYKEDGTDEWIVRGVRFPAMWTAEPNAVVKATGA